MRFFTALLMGFSLTAPVFANEDPFPSQPSSPEQKYEACVEACWADYGESPHLIKGCVLKCNRQLQIDRANQKK